MKACRVGAMSEVWVFAADTIVRFRGGRILLHTSSSRLPAFVTDNPILTGWLCQFAQPIDPNAAIARLPPADQTRVKEILEYLKRSGAVVRMCSRIFEKPVLPAAARVLIGPAEMALTRMPFCPRSAAR